MTTSRSSSHTSHLDDPDVVAHASHFEDISLDDGTTSARRAPARDLNLRVAIPRSHTSPYPSDALAPSRGASSRTLTRQRDVSAQKLVPQREPSRSRSTGRAPGSSGASPNGYNPPRSPGSSPRPPIRSSTSSLYPESLHGPTPGRPTPGPRRKSWQSTRDRKTISDLETQYDDEEEDDDIPDGLFLDNVPISPRPSRDRPTSRPPSPLLAPQNPPKDRRNLGNGTPPVATAQGSLRSPTWKSDSAVSDSASVDGFPAAVPVKGRARSWNMAMAALSPEMQALTEKLEEHSEDSPEVLRAELEKRPATWDASRQVYDHSRWEPQLKKHSQLPELPPLRRNNIMIDPLPVSKEKEAVLSRTRPSWLPPKDPAEERRHLKQYQKMMAMSAEAERRREAARSADTSRRDKSADATMRVWEDEIIPRWAAAIREPRTRDLWWRGVAPRSRGTVWSRAIGNTLGLSEKSYTAALQRAKEAEERVRDGKGDAEDGRRAEWFTAIRRDVGERTWPDLRIFQEGGPLHESLVDVLFAYAMYRGDIGYVPGCNVSLFPLPLLSELGTDSSSPSRRFSSSTSPTHRTPSLPSPTSSTGPSRSLSTQATWAPRPRPTTSSSTRSSPRRRTCTPTSRPSQILPPRPPNLLPSRTPRPHPHPHPLQQNQKRPPPRSPTSPPSSPPS